MCESVCVCVPQALAVIDAVRMHVPEQTVASVEILLLRQVVLKCDPCVCPPCLCHSCICLRYKCWGGVCVQCVISRWSSLLGTAASPADVPRELLEAALERVLPTAPPLPSQSSSHSSHTDEEPAYEAPDAATYRHAVLTLLRA